MAAILNPVSKCCIVAVVVVDGTDDEDGKVWLSQQQERHRQMSSSGSHGSINYYETSMEENFVKPQPQNLDYHETERNILYLSGPEGFSTMLSSSTVDAVFVITPSASQLTQTYVWEALQARKHVLLRDRISAEYEVFMRQLKCATELGCLVQSSTLFVSYHRVKTFLDSVQSEKFGGIHLINAKLIINFNDAEKVGASNPLIHTDGCIKRLGRFCVLVSILLLSRTGSTPVSAQVTHAVMQNVRDEEADQEVAIPVEADCVVRFSNGEILSCNVAYSFIATRQVLTVQARDRYANMTDFVIPHPDGLATYRIYDKEVNPVTGKLEVVKGEALDVLSGPPVEVMMWRRFADLSREVEQEGYSSPRTAGALEMAKLTIQTKRVLLALEESLVLRKEVPVTMPDLTWPNIAAGRAKTT